MNYRRLRIAWSVFWGMVAVLLVVLWVRSYWRVEHNVWNSKKISFDISFNRGRLGIEAFIGPIMMPLGWSRESFPVSHPKLGVDSEADDAPKTILGFGVATDDGVAYACMPLWFPVLASAIGAMLPPPRFTRFSLRSLLIATTLVAVMLGLTVWASR